MPQTAYIISGTIYSTSGSSPDSMVRINSDIQTTTNSKGRYILDLANMVDGYTSGSSYTIESWDEFNNEYKSDTITVTGESQTKDLYLDLRTKEQGAVVGRMNPISIRNLGDKPTSIDNPFSVQNDERPITRKVSGSAYPKYIGEASPGTPENASKWRIKYVKSNGEVTWADGNAKFDKIFDNRTNYSYS